MIQDLRKRMKAQIKKMQKQKQKKFNKDLEELNNNQC